MTSIERLREITDSASQLISADQLKNLLGHPSLKVFDVRGTWKSPARALAEDYEIGHIPGAAFLDWTKHFLEQNTALGLAAVTDKAGAEKAFKALGINEGDLVVLYDNYHHMLAGRLWWAMRYWGFANVRVLNGGWRFWSAQGYPVSTSIPNIEAGTFQPRQQESLRVSLERFLQTQDQHCVIDARGVASFAGQADDPRTGHIPNSQNVPYGAILDPESGLFLDANTIAKVLDEKAPRWRDNPIITSCGSGYAATVIMLGLIELGHEASLFDGSFSAWKQDPNRRVEQSIARP